MWTERLTDRYRLHCKSVEYQVYYHVESDEKLGKLYIANGSDKFTVTALTFEIFDKSVQRPPIQNVIQINPIVPNLKEDTL
jgi:hypothetical protein